MSTPKLPPISEQEFQQQVIDLAKLRNWKVAHFRSVRIQRKDGSCYYATPVQEDGAGFPDLILVRRGEIVVFECKRRGGKTSPEQEAWLAEFSRCQIPAFVVDPDSWDLIERTLE